MVDFAPLFRGKGRGTRKGVMAFIEDSCWRRHEWAAAFYILEIIKST
jgi:hypothetical protein